MLPEAVRTLAVTVGGARSGTRRVESALVHPGTRLAAEHSSRRITKIYLRAPALGGYTSSKMSKG